MNILAGHISVFSWSNIKTWVSLLCVKKYFRFYRNSIHVSVRSCDTTANDQVHTVTSIAAVNVAVYIMLQSTLMEIGGNAILKVQYGFQCRPTPMLT